MIRELGPFSLERAIRAVEKVRQRLLRSTAALESAAVPYAVVGGHAVALWVSRVEEAAVRNTRDVDLMIRRPDLDVARQALKQAGFTYRHVKGIDLFLDGPEARARDAVRLVFAGEQVRPEEPLPNPGLEHAVPAGEFRVLALEALVQIKLTSFRDKDRTHLRDLIDVGLVEQSWLDRVPAELADRLRMLLETPDG